MVIEHGVVVPEDVQYTGELERGLVVVNNLKSRGQASGSRNAEVVLGKLGVLDWIDAIADGNQIQCSKPEPDSFLAAAQAIGVNPQDCLAFVKPGMLRF